MLSPARRTIDASGLVVAPGFIDLLGQSEYNVLVDGRAASKITQGITTEVTGEGESIAPTDEKRIAENEDVYKKYGVRPKIGVREAKAPNSPTLGNGTPRARSFATKRRISSSC